MHLTLTIAGNVIASVPLNRKEVSNLEYVFTERCLLTEACLNTIVAHPEKPVYYIEAPSRMNKFQKAKAK